MQKIEGNMDYLVAKIKEKSERLRIEESNLEDRQKLFYTFEEHLDRMINSNQI